MLGLPTMSLFDLIATDMRASFTSDADLRPYAAIASSPLIFERNRPSPRCVGRLVTLRGTR